MRKYLLPETLTNITLRGFDDDGDDDDTNDGAGDEGGDDDSNEGGEGKGGNGDEDDGNAGLKSALRKERQARRQAEKEAKELKKFREEAEAKDKTETDKAKDEAAKSTAKAEKLAAKLRKSAVDTEIIKHGSKLGFADIEDALTLIDRDLIDVEQDEDEPDDIEIDSKSVEEALKALVKKKPHLLASQGESGGSGRSGSKFNNGQQRSQQQMDDDALRSKYPALNRGSHK